MGKVLRKIAGKVIVLVLKTDGINCTGSLQVCAGQETGIEAAAHSLNSLYNNKTLMLCYWLMLVMHLIC